MYISIDIETTGLDPETCQILSIGAVIEDWETPVDKLPSFECYVDNGKITGSAYALSMHSKILRAIATKDTDVEILKPNCIAEEFEEWLSQHDLESCEKRLTVAGKNFGSFDRQFLERLPYWQDLIHIEHRCIDPGSLYYRPDIDDGLPDTKTCMERAGIAGEVAHTALEDALVVVKLIRKWWEGK